MALSSFESLRATLSEFALSTDPGALLLRGEWGTGKTYATKKALETASFSYVSLYGVSNQDEIYSRIALGLSSSLMKSPPPWVGEIGSFAKAALKSVADTIHINGVFDALGTASIGFMCSKTLVVIDDLERRNDQLSINTVLGVISHLVDSKECRIIFISNDGALNDEDRKVFDLQKEKIFDIEVFYDPSIEENAGIFGDVCNNDYLLPPLRALDIRNLRVIRRVNRILNAFQPQLHEGNKRANEMVLKNIATLGLLYHGFRSVVKLESRNSAEFTSVLARFDRVERELSPSDQLFMKSGYTSCPVDDEIAGYLEGGLVDWDSFNKKLRDKEDEFQTSEAVSTLKEILRKFYGNFISKQTDIERELVNHCEVNAERIDPTDLKMVIELLSKFEQKDIDKPWIERWEKKNISSLSASKLSDIVRGPLKFPKSTVEKANNELKTRASNCDLESILHRRCLGKVSSLSDLTRISQLPASAYVEWIEKSEFPDLRLVITCIFEEFCGRTDPEGRIFRKTLAAVDEVGQRSVFDRIRADSMKAYIPGNHRLQEQ